MEDFTTQLLKKSGYGPIALHIDLIGLLRLGNNNAERIECFVKLLKTLGDSGQRIAIPSFSYSFTKSAVFDVLKTPSEVGFVCEELRKIGDARRSYDGIFSYLLYGDWDSGVDISFVNSFSEGSVSAEIFKDNGWLCSIGGVFRHITEIHSLEKMLNVDYRFDKDFEGVLIDEGGIRHQQIVRYFCRKDMSIRPDFRRFESDLKKEHLMQSWCFGEPELIIEAVKIRDAYAFLIDKMKTDRYYLCIDVNKWVP